MDYRLLQVTKDPDSWHDSDDDELFGPEGDLASVHCCLFHIQVGLVFVGVEEKCYIGFAWLCSLSSRLSVLNMNH